ncbi:MAG: aldehyde dehydrogenase family protein, partial [Actinobacteria bacterium]
MSITSEDPAAHQRRFASDPATGEALGSVLTTPPERIDGVVEAVAKVQSLWALLRVKDRARYMRRMAQAVIDDFDQLQVLLAREQGRPEGEIVTLELLAAIDALIWIADEGAKVLGGRRVGINRSMSLVKRARIAYEPYGVVGVIGAGSAPFAQPLGQIAGALLAGNGIVFKPALRASLAGERIARVLGRAGLPEGLVRIAHGGAEVGVALAQSPVNKVLFTGSPAVGRAVARACVSREKEVTVELGGKDAMLVLADANLPRAVACALWAGCAGAGQARGSIERVYVAREVFPRFLGELISGARALEVGNPADPGVQVGPLASARRVEYLSELVREAVEQGAKVHCGGPVTPVGGAGGAFYAPTVITGAGSQTRLMREPIDGPVLALVPVDSVEEGIRMANDSDYGLGASVWTADRHQGLRIARELHAGMVWLNDHMPGP